MSRARWSYCVAVAVVLAGVVTAPVLFGRLDSSLDPAPSSEAERTEAELVSASGIDGRLAALLEESSVDTGSVLATVAALPGVVEPQLVASETEPAATLLVVGVAADLDDDGREELLDDFATAVEGTAEQVTVGGSLALDEELGETAEVDLLRADAVTIPIVLLAFGLLLGGLRVALVPLLIVVVVLAGSLVSLVVLTTVTTVSVFAVNVATLFGVGLAVDYGLVTVSRFSEERAGGHDVDAAVAITRRTAGRAVMYSGLTTAASLAALLVFAEPVLRSLAYGGITATLLAVATANWLLPPLLSRHGGRLRLVTRIDPDDGRIAELTRRIQRRPGLVVGVVAVMLAAMASPLGSVTFEGLDARSLPAESPNRQLAERLADTHPGLDLAPVEVVVDAPVDSPSTDELAARIELLPAVGRVTVDSLGDWAVLSVTTSGGATAAPSLEIVRAIRSFDIPVEVAVTGEAAEEVDLIDGIGRRLPMAMALLASVTLVLLAIVTRAPVVAVKAVLINVVSVAAAFGVLVALFGDDTLAGLLGVDATGGLSAVVVVVTFAFAFGLSMDYEVFLLVRIREHLEDTGDNDLAVVRGLQHSGRVVTQAAALLVVVFAGFALGDLVLVKQLGIGLALAVIVDVTVVRLVLVPALMTLLGGANWWTPHGPASGKARALDGCDGADSVRRWERTRPSRATGAS